MNLNVAVFLGSNLGNDLKNLEIINDFSEWFGSENHNLIFGGTETGLMLELAKNLSKKKTQIISRKCYLAEKAPGTVSISPNPGYPKELEGKNPKIEDTEIGFENFCVIESKIDEMEWLYLASQGHRRALIKINENNVTTEWLTP